MPIELKDNDFPFLQGIEDYPRWAQHTEAKLQSQNCHDTISSIKVVINSEAATLHLIGLGISLANITPTMLVQWMEKKNSKIEEQESKAIGILKKLVGVKNKQIIEGKSACKIWKTLKDKFKDVSLINQMEIIQKASLMHMLDFSGNTSLYCNTYQAALDQVCGMLQSDSFLNQKSAEGLLQGFMIANVTEAYKPLIASLRENWTSANTDLAKICLSIERYDFVTNNTGTKALHTTSIVSRNPNPNRAPKATCDFESCI